jgi:MarR family transcriptional regulator, organic hydroperoxide resistance regulator
MNRAIGKVRKGRDARRQERNGPAFQLPPTVSRRALLERGSDGRFRQLVYDLLTIAVCMEAVRGYLGERIGLSGPQYSILLAAAQFQGHAGVSVGKIAQVLHVSSAFVTTETGRLARLGLVAKAINPRDRRGVLVRLTPEGRSRIAAIGPQIKSINDRFFAPLERDDFRAFAATVSRLVESSCEVTKLLRLAGNSPLSARRE